ncbi:alpha/beta hydrolase [Paenibacillus amylolyticus]|uniref:alpha/beta hydrolase n=1 Tax=unclassified Paenibacillus TaxID=185978 RepID=UPI0008905113|nr:alpha/beta hydrolase [Paenibacillus sp. CF095]WKL01145.1 alpha/beta hydrolase [Paenibacillus amylolyticus]SDC81808.1 Acetyl esterase/lipase [Paenibacillus sp. CF095]
MTTTIPLWDHAAPYAAQGHEDEMPHLIPFIQPGSESAVIVCPGGGYGFLADHEGAPIAELLNRAGISAFVLKYRVAPHQHPAPITDGQRAIRYVRAHAERYGINPAKIAVLGFSAGGHLTATLGTLYDEGQPDHEDPIERQSSRPDRVILCYPVITMESYGHAGSRENLLGSDATAEQIKAFSAEQQVRADAPEAFIWHTSADQAVPVENSLRYALALGEHGIPYDLHVFEKGSHGLGLAEDNHAIRVWSDLCLTWLKNQGW